MKGYQSDFADGVMILNEEIANLADEDFDAIYQLAKKQSDDIFALEEESKRKEQEERERIEREKAALEAERLRLQKIQEEQDKKERELREAEEKNAAKKIEERGYKLFQLGMRWNGTDYLFEDVSVNIAEITDFSDTEFDKLIENITPAIKKRKEDQEKLAKEKIAADKKAAVEKAKADTEKRLAREAETRRRAEEKEKRRKARIEKMKPDTEKLKSYAAELRLLDTPELKVTITKNC